MRHSLPPAIHVLPASVCASRQLALPQRAAAQAASITRGRSTWAPAHRFISVAALIVSASLAGCSDSSLACESPGNASIYYTIVDSVTLQSVTAETVVWSANGGVPDSVTFKPGQGGLGGISGPPGLYALAVRSPGYRDWVQDSIRVRPNGDPCNDVSTDTINVRLVQQP